MALEPLRSRIGNPDLCYRIGSHFVLFSTRSLTNYLSKSNRQVDDAVGKLFRLAAVKQNFQRFDCGADTLRRESDARSG